MLIVCPRRRRRISCCSSSQSDGPVKRDSRTNLNSHVSDNHTYASCWHLSLRCTALRLTETHKEFDGVKIDKPMQPHFEVHTTTDQDKITFRVTEKAPSSASGDDWPTKSFADMDDALKYMRVRYTQITGREYPSEEGLAILLRIMPQCAIVRWNQYIKLTAACDFPTSLSPQVEACHLLVEAPRAYRAPGHSYQHDVVVLCQQYFACHQI